jgi:ribonuclease P protein component
MLKKENRLNKKILPEKVIKTPFFSIKIKNNALGKNRFGFIVSKRVDKRATGRNRLKRVFRASAQHLLGKIEKGKDLLFIITRPSIEKTQQEIEIQIEEALRKEEIIK